MMRSNTKQRDGANERSITIPVSWIELVRGYKDAKSAGSNIGKGVTKITKLINPQSTDDGSYRDPNHSLIFIHSGSIKKGNPEDMKLCDHCRLPMSDEVLENAFVVPLTYKMEIDEEGNYIHKFGGDGRFGTFSCMLFVLGDSRRYGEVSYGLAKKMWSLIRRDKSAMPKPAPPHYVLREHGGTMQQSQYFNTDNIILEGTIMLRQPQNDYFLIHSRR